MVILLTVSHDPGRGRVHGGEVMSEEWDPDQICRDDDCNRPGVHLKHPVLSRGRTVKVHHRPDPTTVQLALPSDAKPPPDSKRAAWKRDDPKGLTEAVARATSRAYPTHIAAIYRDVQDDYGECTERTVYRHVKKLVERGHLIKLDVGLSFAAYIRPKSRLLKDHAAIREYLLGIVELNPTTKRARKVKAPEPKLEREPTRELVTPSEAQIARVRGGGSRAEHARVRSLGTRRPVARVNEYLYTQGVHDGTVPRYAETKLDELADVVNG